MSLGLEFSASILDLGGGYWALVLLKNEDEFKSKDEQVHMQKEETKLTFSCKLY